MKIRKSNERGRANHGWLDARHTFSFGSYYDPQHMNYRSLRVINEDRIKPAKGFGAHPHDNMEILTYIISGALAHKDSMGNTEVISAGQFQRMSAGTGVVHSEFNASDQEEVHLLQIWIQPNQLGLPPSYQDYRPDFVTEKNQLLLIAAGPGREAPLTVHQNIELLVARIDSGATVHSKFANASDTWVQVVSGSLSLNGSPLLSGDGAALDGAEELKIVTEEQSEILVFRFLD